MRIENLKVGLYFTLPEENLVETREHGNNFNKRFPDDQRYKYYTAVKNEDEWYMINTYQLPHFYVEDEKNIEQYIEKMERNQTLFCNSPYGYYHTCKIKLDQDVLDLFDFVFDLRDCKVLEREEAENYNREDFIEIELYWEHNYPRGIILAKKDKNPDVQMQQLKILNDLSNYMKTPYFSQHGYNISIEKLEKLDGHSEKLLEEVKMWSNKIKEMQDEINKLEKSFEWIDPRYGKIKHSKIDEFLENK